VSTVTVQRPARDRHAGALRLAGLVALIAASLVGASSAGASQLIDRNATDVHLEVNAKGEALVTYTAGGQQRHVLAWGALNARPPSRVVPQEHFELDYTGGYRKYFLDNPTAQHLAAAFHRIQGTPGYLANPLTRELEHVQRAADDYWQQGFDGNCGRYTGPALPYLVAACTAPDGSYWALQAWPEQLPDLGYSPWLTSQSSVDLDLSHWTGDDVAKLLVVNDWVYNGMWEGFFGQLTYQGEPVYGFKSTRYGAPLDNYEALVYLDTYDSTYGPGWRRENAFLTHSPNGTFCYGFYPHNPTIGGNIHPPGQTTDRGPGTGSSYRITVNGPGVSPDITLTWPGLSVFERTNVADVTEQDAAMATFGSLMSGDTACHSDPVSTGMTRREAAATIYRG
jgi:hypothetical protein